MVTPSVRVRWRGAARRPWLWAALRALHCRSRRETGEESKSPPWRGGLSAGESHDPAPRRFFGAGARTVNQPPKLRRGPSAGRDDGAVERLYWETGLVVVFPPPPLPPRMKFRARIP